MAEASFNNAAVCEYPFVLLNLILLSLLIGHKLHSCFRRVLFHPVRMVMVPPRHYCVIQNPVLRDATRNAQFDDVGQAKLRHGDQEIRLTQDPFPLYPGEELQQVCPLCF